MPELEVGSLYYVQPGDIRFDAVARLERVLLEPGGGGRKLLMFVCERTSVFFASIRYDLRYFVLIASHIDSEKRRYVRGHGWLPTGTGKPQPQILEDFRATVPSGSHEHGALKPVGSGWVVGEVVPWHPSDVACIQAAELSAVALRLDCGFTFAAAPIARGEFHDRDAGVVTTIELRSVIQSDDPRRLFSPDRFENPLTPGEFKEWDDACRFILVRRSGERLWDSWWGPSPPARGGAGVLIDRVDSVEDMAEELKRFAYMGRCKILGEIKFADPRFAWR